MEIKIRLKEEVQLPEIRRGNCCDLYSASVGVIRCDLIPEVLKFNDQNIMWHKPGVDEDMVHIYPGDVVFVDTGVAISMPEDWFNLTYARSSNFLKSGLILTNSVGVIDHEYKGNNDTWKGVFYATRKSSIDITKPLLQFTPIKDTIHQFQFSLVNDLESEDRGGYGSTDKQDV